MKKRYTGKSLVVFFDFDNTITTKDVLDDMLVRFSKDDKWQGLEEKWKNNQIGSMACLKGQIEGIRITKDELDKYLLTIQIDPYFKKLLDFLRYNKVRAMIVSDNFDYILKRILKNNGIDDLEVYCNKMKILEDRLKPSFPLSNRSCGECAHCKKTTLLENLNEGDVSAYVGDGQSDVCGSQEADIVFAKDFLKNYYKTKKLPHVPIKGLKDIYEYFEEKAS